MKESLGLTAIQKLLNSEADERMLELLKESPKFGQADIYAKKAVHMIFENAPTDAMENFIYLILANYYSYKYLLNTIAQIEKNAGEGKRQ